jgi:hypothetical protein
VVGAYYYLRIIKVMFLDDPVAPVRSCRGADRLGDGRHGDLHLPRLPRFPVAVPRHGAGRGARFLRAMIPTGWSVVTLDTVGSTNDEAMARAEAGAPEGTVIRALRQEAGRGRRGRGWDSPPGNVYSSTILRPPVPPAQAAQLSFVTALAVADMAAPLIGAGHHVAIKWPNDVLVDDAKISGILLEIGAGRGRTDRPRRHRRRHQCRERARLRRAMVPRTCRRWARPRRQIPCSRPISVRWRDATASGAPRIHRHARRMVASRGMAGPRHRGLAGRDGASRPLRRP